MRLVRQAASLPTILLTGILLLWSSLGLSQQQTLPPVTGVVFDGQTIAWDPVPGAVGYNIFQASQYRDTVIGVTSYVPEFTGIVVITAFDSDGNFSPILDLPDRSNQLEVSQISRDVAVPANVSGTVYSSTAGEVFWERLLSRNLEYVVFVNGSPAGTTTGSSLFIDSLVPDTLNIVILIARSATGEESAPVVLEFNTQAGPFPEAANLITLDQPATIRPDAPSNTTIELYSISTAELFWDRPPAATNIVATDIFRDGVLIGTTDGISFFDDTGEFGFNRRVDSPHRYELVAINADGARSLPAVVNPGAFDGPTADIIDRLLTGLTEVTTDNPHLEWFPILQDLAQDDALQQLEVISDEPTVDGNVLLSRRTEYACDFGSLVVVSVPSAIINTSLTFSECDLESGFFDGGFSLMGLDAGGYTAEYDDLSIDLIDFPVNLDGEVTVSVGRGTGSRILTYNNFEYFIIGNLFDDDRLDTIVQLNQQVADTVLDQPRTFFTTEFTANAPWTNGRDVTVSTTRRFEDADLGNSNYLAGELIFESTGVESGSSRLVLTADTGNPISWTGALTTDVAEGAVLEQPVGGSWGEAVRLPCISAFLEDVETTGCPL